MNQIYVETPWIEHKIQCALVEWIIYGVELKPIPAQESGSKNAATSVTATDSDHEAPLPQRNGRRRKKKSVTIGDSSSPTKEVRSRIDTGLNKEPVESAASRRKIKFSKQPQKLDISERPEWK